MVHYYAEDLRIREFLACLMRRVEAAVTDITDMKRGHISDTVNSA